MKKMNEAKRNLLGCLAILLLFLVGFSGCMNEEIPIETTDDILMGAYIEENPQFSEFLKLAEKTGNTGFINAYGLYTCFLPSDSAFNVYYAENEKSSLDDFSDEELKELFKYHIVNDTISSVLFTDGKLKSPSMNGKYLITGVKVNELGQANYVVNKQSVIENIDVAVGNGIIHEIDQVLDPPKLTVAEMIKNNPDYSIFSQALEETTLDDTLMQNNDRWFTVFVQSDAVYQQMGINSYADLKAKYSHLGEPSNPSDSLYLYMAYHCMEGVNYIADLVLSKSHLTLAPLEVITVEVEGDKVLINEQEIAGMKFKGAEMNRAASDNSAQNGVYHELNGNIYIKVLLPVPVYWDPTFQPEMRKLTGIYKTPGFSEVNFGQGELENIEWGGTNTSVSYNPTGPTIDNDVLSIYLRTSVIPWVEMKTPLLIKGTYKVWFAFRTNPYGNTIQVSFNDEVLPNLLQIGFYGKRPAEISEDDYEALGYKYYLEDSENNRVACQLLGTVEVEYTGQHTLRFDAITNNRGYLWLDMVQFIPVDMDQRWPKFDYEGNFVYEPEEPVEPEEREEPVNGE